MSWLLPRSQILERRFEDEYVYEATEAKVFVSAQPRPLGDTTGGKHVHPRDTTLRHVTPREIHTFLPS